MGLTLISVEIVIFHAVGSSLVLLLGFEVWVAVRNKLKKSQEGNIKGELNSYYAIIYYFSKMPQSIEKSRFCLVAPQGVYILSTPVPTSLESSNSFILALSEFLANIAKIYP